MGKIYRQGDIVLEKVSRIPDGYILTDSKLSMSGETGNAHVLEGKVYGSTRNQVEGNPRKEVRIGTRPLTLIEEYIEVNQDNMAMVHAEHPSLPVEKGIYKIRRLRTYTPERPRPAYD